MFCDLRVFFVLPAKMIVYSLEDDQGNKFIYNAGSLKHIDPTMEITGFTEISGIITNRFETKPVVVGYSNDKLEVVYAPQKFPYVFTSDGFPARTNQEAVVRATILVPDLDKSVISSEDNLLVELPLTEPNSDSLSKYFELSEKGKTQNVSENYFDLKTKELLQLSTRVPKAQIPTVSMTSLCNEPVDSSPQTNSRIPRSPSPRIFTPKAEPKEKISDTSELSQQINDMKTYISELEGVVRAMGQRLYQIYPVDCPKELRVNGKLTKIITVPEIQEKMNQHEIERFDLDPCLQAYAGSHRRNNRMLTFYSKDGEMYLVRADYDPKTNKINPPT